MFTGKRLFDINEALSRRLIDPSDLHAAMNLLDREVDRIALLVEAARILGCSLDLREARLLCVSHPLKTRR
jgi:hypothetical protein